MAPNTHRHQVLIQQTSSTTDVSLWVTDRIDGTFISVTVITLQNAGEDDQHEHSLRLQL